MLENELADICLCEGKKNKISKSSNKRETWYHNTNRQQSQIIT